MKNYAKMGGRAGRPAYRTPSSFRYKKSMQAAHIYPMRNFHRVLTLSRKLTQTITQAHAQRDTNSHGIKNRNIPNTQKSR